MGTAGGKSIQDKNGAVCLGREECPWRKGCCPCVAGGNTEFPFRCEFQINNINFFLSKGMFCCTGMCRPIV